MQTRSQGGTIIVNGMEQPVPSDGTVSSLLTSLDINLLRLGVAVALNGEVLPRAAWKEARLKDGDHVEVVRPSQGG
jgi:sulfur carrier protein